jgi:sugar lactone lactonase YvrE
MTDRRVMRQETDGTIAIHADLADHATGHCNDMVVDSVGNAYVGNFGFDLEGGAEPAATSLHLVRPDGSVEVAATDLLFPNGAVITDEGATLVVGQSFGATYTAFDIAPDATLSGRRTWADVPGMAPDGCTIDADGGIWFSDAVGKQVVRVVEGGEITDRRPTADNTYACMLAGASGDQLFALTCADSHPAQAAGTGTGKLVVTTVAVGRNATDLP